MKSQRWAILAVLLLALIMAGSGLGQEKGKGTRKEKEKGKEEKPTGSVAVSVTIPLVTLNVVVSDKNGNLVTGLNKDCFKVYEDGVPQEITNFFSDRSPINVVLLLESSQRIYGLEQDFWSAIQDFMRNLRPDDYCALVTYDIKPRIAEDFTQDKNKVVQEANMSVYFKGFNESCLCDAVVFVVDRMHQVEGKKAVVMLSTGQDTFSRTTYSKALDAVSASDTVIYSISMGQLARLRYEQYYTDVSLAEFQMCDTRLKFFSQKTGGAAFFPKFTTEFPAIFRNINLFLRYQYTLAYKPTNQQPGGKLRKIKVEVAADINNDGTIEELKATHREGYKAPK